MDSDAAAALQALGYAAAPGMHAEVAPGVRQSGNVRMQKPTVQGRPLGKPPLPHGAAPRRSVIEWRTSSTTKATAGSVGPDAQCSPCRAALLPSSVRCSDPAVQCFAMSRSPSSLLPRMNWCSAVFRSSARPRLLPSSHTSRLPPRTGARTGYARGKQGPSEEFPPAFFPST